MANAYQKPRTYCVDCVVEVSHKIFVRKFVEAENRDEAVASVKRQLESPDEWGVKLKDLQDLTLHDTDWKVKVGGARWERVSYRR